MTDKATDVTVTQAVDFIDKFFRPWGSWKTVWWEGEVSDDAAFSSDNALKHVANILRRTAHSGEGRSNDDVLCCDECGRPNPVWFAPSDVWNLAVGGADATDDPGGVLCPICFIAKAETAGIKPNGWRIEPEGRSNGAGDVQAVRDDQCNVEFGTVPDCDCPHEHWHIGGVCLDVHIEDDGSGHSILGNDDWQLEVKGVESIDEMRAIAFAWSSQKYGFASLSAPQGEVKRPDAEEDDRSWLGTSIDRIDAMEEAAQLRAVVEQAARWFEEYAVDHEVKARRASDTYEHASRNDKAKRNQERADYLRAALSKYRTDATKGTDIGG